MPYGTIKVDNITFTNGGSDTTITVSGLAASTTGNLTVTGTISGAVVRATTVSGVTVTGTTVQGASGTFTSITGGIATITSGVFALGSVAAPSISFSSDSNTGIYSPGADQVAISTNGVGRLFVDASGLVGINTTSPNAPLTIGGTDPQIYLGTSPFGASIQYTNGTGDLSITGRNTYSIIFANTTERMRVDGSGRLLVGTSSNNVTFNSRLQVKSDNNTAIGIVIDHYENDTTGGIVFLSKSRSATVGTMTVVQNGDTLGQVQFWGADGTQHRQGASIAAVVDAAPGAADMPSRLVFSTTADGASSPTERMRITSAGLVGIGTSSPAGKINSVISQADTASPSDTTLANSFLHLGGGEYGNGRYFLTTYGYSTGRTNSGAYIGALGAAGVDYGKYHLVFGTRDVTSDTAPTERARIDSSGRLLVGTSTARANFYNGTDTGIFQVEGANDITKRFSSFIYGRDNADGPLLLLGKHRGTSVGGTTVVASGDEIGRITFQGSDGTQFVAGAEIQAYVDATPGADDMPGRLVFSTTADGASSPTERMRIGNDGFTRLFVTNNDGFQSRSSAAAGTIIAVYAGLHSATSTTTGTLSYVVWNNGNVVNSNNSYGSLSDLKLKENIVDAASQWADIKALQVRKYNFKEGQTHTQIGLIAQEVELVSPGLVTESPDRDAEGNDLGTVTKSVNYSVLYMKAVKALQEAMERIEQLEAKVAALESA